MKVIIDGSGPGVPNVNEMTGALRRYGFSRDSTALIFKMAVEEPAIAKEWKTDDGWVTVRYHGFNRFTLEEHAGKSLKRVAPKHPRAYTSGKASNSQRKDPPMAPRARRAAAPEPEVAEQDGAAFDPQAWFEKDLTNTLADYAEWFRKYVGDPDKMDSDRLIAAGCHFYGEFQRSDFNKERKAERKAARGAPADAEPDEPAPARPARRGKPASTAKASTASAPASAAPARPARRGTGRGRGAAAPADAAY